MSNIVQYFFRNLWCFTGPLVGLEVYQPSPPPQPPASEESDSTDDQRTTFYDPGAELRFVFEELQRAIQ